MRATGRSGSGRGKEYCRRVPQRSREVFVSGANRSTVRAKHSSLTQ